MRQVEFLQMAQTELVTQQESNRRMLEACEAKQQEELTENQRLWLDEYTTMLRRHNQEMDSYIQEIKIELVVLAN